MGASVLELLGVLLPLVIASALVPIQLTITLILLRSSFTTASMWVAGMTVARLAQAALVLFAASAGAIEVRQADGPSELLSYLFLGVAAVFYLTAAKQTRRAAGERVETPAWLGKAQSPRPMTAFGWGVGYLTLSVKSASLNMAGVAAIAESGLVERTLLATLLFIAICEAGHLALLATAALEPDRARTRLDAIDGWLARHDRVIVISMGAVFGTWFLVIGAQGLGWL